MVFPYKSSNEENDGRKEHDYYSTPVETTAVLMDYLMPVMDPKLHTIMEPACGEGKMSDVIKDRGFNVASSDLYEYDYDGAKHAGDFKIQDFLEVEAMSNSWVITNPPFNLAEEFIRKAAELQNNNDGAIGFAMLLKSTYWHAKSRYPLFVTDGPTVILPLTWRPKFNEQSTSPVLDMAWNIWFKNRDVFDTKFITQCAYVPVTKPAV